MKKIKILLADSNKENTRQIATSLSIEDSFQIIAETSDGNSTIEKISQIEPDVVVMDILLPILDGFDVMSTILNSNCKKPIFIIASSLTKDSFVTKAINCGASYYMVKPINSQILCERIKELMGMTAPASLTISEESLNAKLRRADHALDEKLANIFISVGIPAHIKGYQFLREAIKTVIKDPEIINSITKKLYPTIAEKYDTSTSKVERAIRHAIEVAWNRGKMENINTIFGIKVYTVNDKPTNGEFIALLADKMIMEGA